MDNAKAPIYIRKTILALFVLSFFVIALNAQLAEIAGPLTFQVQVGHSQTLQLELIDEGNSSISILMTPPNHLQVSSNMIQAANQTTPTLTIYPTNFTISPHSTFPVNITIYMPLNNTPYLTTWEGILSAQETSNTSNPGGAVVIEGVAKIFTAAAIPSTTTTTTTVPTTIAVQQPVSSSPLLPIIAVIILAIIVVAAYYYMISNKKTGKKKGRAAKKAAPESMEDRLARLERQNAQLRRQMGSKKGRARGARPRAKTKARARTKKKTTRKRRR